MVDHIKIHKAHGTWTVRAGGAVLAESTNALELIEGGQPPVIYFPRADIAMAFLDASERSGHDPHKGEAVYYSIETKNRTIENAAWSFEAPKAGLDRIAGHIAFFTGTPDVTVERI